MRVHVSALRLRTTSNLMRALRTAIAHNVAVCLAGLAIARELDFFRAAPAAVAVQSSLSLKIVERIR